MSEQERSSKSAPPLWPSVVIAAILAIALPVIHFFVSDPFGLTVILLPIYIPLAFAFIWPILITCQGPIPGRWRERHTVALVMFLASLGSSALWIEAERVHFRSEAREESQKQQQLRAAQEIISTKGVLAFSEPLNPGESSAIIRYLHEHLDMPASDMLRISETYQDVGVMRELVRMKGCPPEALKIIFENTVKNRENASGLNHWAVEETFLDLAHREDTPSEVLSRLVMLPKADEFMKKAAEESLQKREVAKP
jgi:hypothetical protein